MMVWHCTTDVELHWHYTTDVFLTWKLTWSQNFISHSQSQCDFRENDVELTTLHYIWYTPVYGADWSAYFYNKSAKLSEWFHSSKNDQHSFHFKMKVMKRTWLRGDYNNSGIHKVKLVILETQGLSFKCNAMTHISPPCSCSKNKNLCPAQAEERGIGGGGIRDERRCV